MMQWPALESIRKWQIDRRFSAKFLAVLVIPIAGVSLNSSLASEAAVIATRKCLDPQSQNTTARQASHLLYPKEICSKVVVGSMDGVWYAAELINRDFDIHSRQFEIGNLAVKLACTHNSKWEWSAVGLIMVCQCRDRDVVDVVKNSRDLVLDTLRDAGGCN